MFLLGEPIGINIPVVEEDAWQVRQVIAILTFIVYCTYELFRSNTRSSSRVRFADSCLREVVFVDLNSLESIYAELGDAFSIRLAGNNIKG